MCAWRVGAAAPHRSSGSLARLKKKMGGGRQGVNGRFRLLKGYNCARNVSKIWWYRPSLCVRSIASRSTQKDQGGQTSAALVRRRREAQGEFYREHSRGGAKRGGGATSDNGSTLDGHLPSKPTWLLNHTSYLWLFALAVEAARTAQSCVFGCIFLGPGKAAYLSPHMVRQISFKTRSASVLWRSKLQVRGGKS